MTFTSPCQATISGTVTKGGRATAPMPPPSPPAWRLQRRSRPTSAMASRSAASPTRPTTSPVNQAARSPRSPATAVRSPFNTRRLWQPAGSGTASPLADHPRARRTGPAITAGYQFYVPCRFDTDTLPLTLEDYGIGSRTVDQADRSPADALLRRPCARSPAALFNELAAERAHRPRLADHPHGRTRFGFTSSRPAVHLSTASPTRPPTASTLGASSPRPTPPSTTWRCRSSTPT